MMRRHVLAVCVGAVLAVAVWCVWAQLEPAAEPAPVPQLTPLPPPSLLDEQIILQANGPHEGLGSAFAITASGDWITARHVVEGCSTVSLLIGEGGYVAVEAVTLDPVSDLALLKTSGGGVPVNLALASGLLQGAPGYFVGYPQGQPGEVAARLVARGRLIVRGDDARAGPILAWTESARTPGLAGTLSGLSGAPVFDAGGTVSGVVIAESVRRGRIYTAPPDVLAAFLARLNVTLDPGPAAGFDSDTYASDAGNARRQLQVVKVSCEVSSD
jgi:serine protease Do